MTKPKRASKNTRTMQQRAADYMASGNTIGETCEKLGVKYATLLSWQYSEAFEERMARHRDAGRRRTGILFAENVEEILSHAFSIHATDKKELLFTVAQLMKTVGTEVFFAKNLGKTPPEFGKTPAKNGIEPEDSPLIAQNAGTIRLVFAQGDTSLL